MEERVLEEHESHRNRDEQQDQPEMSNADRKLLKRIEKNFHQSKLYREKFDHKWMDYYKMFRGRQWKEERPPYRHSEVINMVFSAIQSVIPIMTDSRPRFEYLPTEPSDRPFAELINQLAEHDWARNNWNYTVAECLYDSHFFGTGFSSMKWDPKLEYGIGGIRYESNDTFHFYPTPKVKTIQDDDLFIIAYPMSLEEIKKRWPKKAKYVKPDIETNKYDRTELSKMRYVSPTDQLQLIEAERLYSEKEGKEALVIEAYIKDEEIESEENEKVEVVKTDDGLARQEISKTFKHRKKYPGGRRVVIANKVILEDKPNEYKDQKWPYSQVKNYIDPHQFWGISEVEQLEGPQKTFNKLISFVLDILTMMGNPIIVMDTNTGIDPDMVYNEPGLIVTKNPGSEFRREEGVQLQPYVIQIIDRMKSYFDDISGSTDVSKGISPTTGASGFAIDQLQEAAQTRIRQKSRNLDVMLNDIGQMYVSRVLQFYNTPRVVRITNNQDAQQFFKVEFQEDDQGQVFAKRQNFTENELGRPVPDGSPEIIPLSGQLDVKVVTGSLLPFSKTAKESKLIALYRDGIIDREEVLKGIDHPNWEGVLERVTAAEQAQAQAAQAQIQ
jgi:hypothetical protein